MERTERVTITNMCMVYKNNRVLVQDKVGTTWKGVTFPGGHVEKGESFTQAVIREVFEETGLTIHVPQLCGIKDWTNDDGSRYMVLLYKTDSFEGMLKSSAEGKVYWTTFEELLTAELAKDMEQMLKVFTDDNLSEFYYYQENGEWVYKLQ